MASAVMATLSAGGSSHGTSSVLVGASSSPPSLTEQLDEVQLLEAMVGREGEFEWRQDEHGLVSGRLQVFLQLDQELVVRVARRERKATAGQNPSPHPNPHTPTAATPTSATSSTRACITRLPPVSLYFELPPTYPQSDKPHFTLSCSWLNFTQLSTLCQHLDAVWDSDLGSVVLYNWQQFLSSDLLTTLNVSSDLVLQFEDPTAADDNRDKRAVQEMQHPSVLLQFLRRYDKEEQQREFAQTFHDCEICFSCVAGTKCRRLNPCGHTHCCECLTLHVSTKIRSGEVTRILCPSGSCDVSLPPNLIRELVSADVFERFDRLLLQKTLDKMSDIVYCPRPSCQCVTLREEDGTNMALCPRCRFSFCILCKHAWHGIEPCKILPQDMQELRKTWEQLGPEEREALQQQYGKSKLEKAFQEHDSIEWLQSNARKCPNCEAKIQKSLGCNKMTCTHCNSNFCWLCSIPLPTVDPYRHFRVGRSSCAGRLFEGITDSDEEDWF